MPRELARMATMNEGRNAKLMTSEHLMKKELNRPKQAYYSKPVWSRTTRRLQVRKIFILEPRRDLGHLKVRVGPSENSGDLASLRIQCIVMCTFIWPFELLNNFLLTQKEFNIHYFLSLKIYGAAVTFFELVAEEQLTEERKKALKMSDNEVS